MPRIVRVFALEEIGSMNEPIISTPIGSLSARQSIILAAFLFAGWSCYVVLSKIIDPIASLMAFVGFAVAGLVVATKKVKAIPIEVQLYYMLFKPKKRAAGKRRKKEEEEAEEALPAAKSLSMTIEAEEVVPKKISGELKDSFGKLLKNTEYYVYVNDRKYSEKAFSSDSMGRYEFFFVPPSAGVFQVKVVPKGYTVPCEVINVRVERGE